MGLEQNVCLFNCNNSFCKTVGTIPLNAVQKNFVFC